jgi:hypothetical protein
MQDDALVTLNRVSFFGFMQDMKFVSPEFEGLGQLRYIVHGSRSVRCVSISALASSAGIDLKTCNMGDLKSFVESMTAAKFADHEVPMCAFEQKAGQFSYVPSGWIVADRSENNQPVVGLRMTAISKSNLADWQLHRQIVDRTEPGSKFGGFADALAKFMTTGIAAAASASSGSASAPVIAGAAKAPERADEKAGSASAPVIAGAAKAPERADEKAVAPASVSSSSASGMATVKATAAAVVAAKGVGSKKK